MRKFTVLAAAAALGALVSGTAAQAQTVPLTYSQALAPQSVQMVQQRMRQMGAYQGAIDGQWGPDSVIGLQRFQQMHGIQPTGQLNEATLASLGIDPGVLLGSTSTAYAPPTPAYVTPSPRAVAAVQGRLRELGYYRGGVDGVWGPETQQALASFQQRDGLQPNAALNSATVRALGLNPSWVLAGG